MNAKAMNYKSQRALVTGASSGIGAAFARELASRGSDLVLVARSRDKLTALGDDLSTSYGVAADVVVADLAKPSAASHLAAELGDRQIDILVNNAGFGLHALLHQADAATLTEMVQLNVATLVDLTRLYLPGMLARDRGAVINVASTAAFQPVPYMAVYGASKAFVLSFTEALWAETRRTDVRVTALCPGSTETEFFTVAGENAQVGSRMAPERVVHAALRALDRRGGSVVTGAGNRLLINAPRLAPRPFVTRMVERTMRPAKAGRQAEDRVIAAKS
jgi:uncharacterized protein